MNLLFTSYGCSGFSFYIGILMIFSFYGLSDRSLKWPKLLFFLSKVGSLISCLLSLLSIWEDGCLKRLRIRNALLMIVELFKVLIFLFLPSNLSQASSNWLLLWLFVFELSQVFGSVFSSHLPIAFLLFYR